MKQIFSSLFVTLFVLLLSSCSTGKKLQAANDQIEQLKQQVITLSGKVEDDEKMLSQLKAENIQCGKEAEDCREVKRVIEQKWENLETNLKAEGTSMQNIREKAIAAIGKFEHEGATVTYKNGLVHVNFENKFFFKSGSTTIASKGRESLNMIAEVLREHPNVTCIVVGNTDNTLASNAKDNWSISTERANAVVRILHDTYNINPSRLTAAGKSEYNPAADNSTAEGREKNRRVEIIFNPNLSRLLEMMNN